MGRYKYHQYQVVGRHIPTEKFKSPILYRMKIWASDVVRAKSNFWHSMRKICRVKKTNGQIVSCNEIFENNPSIVKNFGIWIRYQSRNGYHNAYKECRNTTMNAAIHNMFQEMASRHRVSYQCIKIIRTAVIHPSECRRINNLQFQDSKIKFLIFNEKLRSSSKVHKTLFIASRPNVALY
jgi:large subunit ribosomal protein L18Ae